DIVVSGQLIWDPSDNWRRRWIEKIGDLVELPVKGGGVVRVGRSARHHAEHRFRSAPMDRRLAHGDAVSVLRAGNAVTRGSGEIPDGAAGIADVEIAPARRPPRSAKMIAESGGDGDKAVRDHIGVHLVRNGDL